MAEYHYLVATLPYLRFPGDMPISRAEFLARCQAQLPPAEFDRLAGLDRVPRELPTSDIEARWNAWETAVRNTFARLRAVRRGVQADDYFRPELDAFADLEKQVMEIFDGNRNPADERRSLDRLRWQKLSDLEAGHQFDFEFLVIYHLKLVLLEKWADLSAERGAAELQRVVEELIPQLDVLEHIHA